MLPEVQYDSVSSSAEWEVAVVEEGDCSLQGLS